MASITPITGDYRSGKGRLYVQILGSSRLEEVGDVDDFNLTIENERLERFTNQTGTRSKTESRLLQQNATVTFTAVQNTARNLAIAFMSDKNFLTQAAATGTAGVTGVIAGDVVDLGVIRPTGFTVNDGTPTGVYTLGTHFEYEKSGLVKVLALPTGVGANLAITYVKEAITTADKLLKAGLGAEPDLEGKLVFVAVDANNDPIEKVTIHRVKLAPNGDIAMIADEWRTVPITGEVILDSTKSDGYQLAVLEDLTTRTNAGAAD